MAGSEHGELQLEYIGQRTEAGEWATSQAMDSCQGSIGTALGTGRSRDLSWKHGTLKIQEQNRAMLSTACIWSTCRQVCLHNIELTYLYIAARRDADRIVYEADAQL